MSYLLHDEERRMDETKTAALEVRTGRPVRRAAVIAAALVATADAQPAETPAVAEPAAQAVVQPALVGDTIQPEVQVQAPEQPAKEQPAVTVTIAVPVAPQTQAPAVVSTEKPLEKTEDKKEVKRFKKGANNDDKPKSKKEVESESEQEDEKHATKSKEKVSNKQNSDKPDIPLISTDEDLAFHRYRILSNKLIEETEQIRKYREVKEENLAKV